MECKPWLKWFMLALICLIAGASSSMSERDSSCPKGNLNITGGIFVLSDSYSHGSLLRYICPSGYYPSVQSRRCQYGHWTSNTKIRKTPECKKITCPNPRVFENGEVNPYKAKYYVNDTTTYSCHHNYTFRGSAVRVCKPNGKWSGSTPICRRDSDHCPDPGVPPGSSRTGSIFNIDNKVTYCCESPLTLIGSKVRVCPGGGQWSGTEPQCYNLYVFGVGGDVNQEDINGLVSQRDHEKYFFKFQDLTEMQEMFDDMIDESTSVGLCGIVWEGLDYKRRAFPWLAHINIAHHKTSSNCMGSLVSSSYILTAAHCFKEGDTPDKITVKLEKDLVVKVKKYVIHPDFDLTAKQEMGIQEYYEFDVALIQLEEPVDLSSNLRPICIPCTKETNAALKLSETEGTCRKHEEIIMSNELVEAAFASDMDSDNSPKTIKSITIKLGKYRDACVEDAKKSRGIDVKNAREAVTDNFLCSGGTEPTTDDVACKGDFGGATYVNKKGRVIQVGVLSWGVKDICKGKKRFTSDADSRDYHSNLFSEKIRSFLKEHLQNDRIGNPLTFL